MQLRSMTVLAVLAVACSAESDEVVRVERCDWPAVDEPRWSWPIGYGVAKNTAATTLLDRPLTIEPSIAPSACFTARVVEIVESARHGAASIDPDGRIDYQPAPGFVGFDPMVARVELTRSEALECEGASPPDHEGHGAFLDGVTPSGGFDLARIGIHVIAGSASVLPPCTSDCVELEVVDVAGIRIPTSILEQAGPDDHPLLGCTDDHWLGHGGGHPINGPGEVLSTDLFPLDEPGMWFLPSSKLKEWYGDCGVGVVSQVQPRTVRVSRQAFESYCEASWHNYTAPDRSRLMQFSDVAAGSDEDYTWEPDWPELTPDVQALRTGPRPSETTEALAEMLRNAKPQDVVDYVTKALKHLHAEDEPYYRALRWGQAWSAFETDIIDLVTKIQADEWSRMSIDEQASAIDGLLAKLNTALGEKFKPLKDYAMGAASITDKVMRVEVGFRRLNSIYEVFSVDPNDPLHAAQALGNYLRLLADITGKPLPIVGMYVDLLADGVENALPHLRTMRDRNRATSRAIDDWLVPTEEFVEDWTDFAVTDSLSEAPALDAGYENSFHEGWYGDLFHIRRVTWEVASLYDVALRQQLAAVGQYMQVDWEKFEELVRARHAGLPFPDSAAQLQRDLDAMVERRAALGLQMLEGFWFAEKTRVQFYKQRLYAINKIVSARGGPSRPGVSAFLTVYWQTLLTQVGPDPWVHKKRRGG